MYLNCYPMRIEWESRKGVTATLHDWPPPEVPARLVQPGDPVPASARRLHQQVMELTYGLARMTYARGTALGRQGRPGPVVDSVAVRARRPDGGVAVAVWVDGKLGGVWCKEPGDIPRSARSLRRPVQGSGGKWRSETATEVVLRWLGWLESVPHAGTQSHLSGVTSVDTVST